METERPLLNDTVQTLSRITRDLEKQLERVLEINEALERDLDKERKNTAKVTQERNRLADQISQLEGELSLLEDTRAELGHLTHERARLSGTIEELGNQAAETELENRKLNQLAERMRIERDDAIEELQSVEAQFERAMEMAGDLKYRLTALSDDRESVIKRLRILDTQLKETGAQRDTLKVEVEESKQALDEIRRQISSTMLVPQLNYNQKGEL